MAARWIVQAWLAATVALAPVGAAAQALGEAGESCRARSDCAEGLRCIDNVCTAAADGVLAEPAPEPASAAPVESPEAAPAEDQAGPDGGGGGWTDFALGGAHGFAGLGLGPALTGEWYYGNEPTWRAGMQLALRGGVLLDRMELALELAPDTLWWNLDRAPVLSFNVTIGGLIEIAPRLYWPLRFGLGVTGVNLPHDETCMQGRLDLVGLAYLYGHVLFELSLFSARFSSEFHHFGLWTVPFTISASYVF